MTCLQTTLVLLSLACIYLYVSMSFQIFLGSSVSFFCHNLYRLYLSVLISSKHDLCTSRKLYCYLSYLKSSCLTYPVSSYRSWSCYFLIFFIQICPSIYLYTGSPLTLGGGRRSTLSNLVLDHFHSGKLSHSFLTFAVKACLGFSDFTSYNFSPLVAFCLTVSLWFLLVSFSSHLFLFDLIWTYLTPAYPMLSNFVSCYLTL